MVNKAHLFQIRLYEAARDRAMIERWHLGHGSKAPPEAVLPALGVICYRTDGWESEDIAAGWLYFDTTIGVCFLEHCVTKPKLPTKVMTQAMLTGVDFLKKRALEMGYGIMIAHTLPALARWLRRAGFHPEEKMVELVPVYALTDKAA
jgi:hypothetical protein